MITNQIHLKGERMDRYLDNYIGKYRVKAHYDLDTNDFPRDKNGAIYDTFADFYLDCYGDVEIKHVCPEPRKRNHELACYVPNVKRGKHILKMILRDNGIKCGRITDDDKLSTMVMKKTDLFTEVEFTDEELWFSFKPENLEYMGKFIRIKTSGANISPLSSKNLPKVQPVLPKEEKQRYQKIVKKFHGEALDKARLIKIINKEFEKQLPKNWTEQAKQLKMDFKSYIYHKGLWDKYLDKLLSEMSKNN